MEYKFEAIWFICCIWLLFALVMTFAPSVATLYLTSQNSSHEQAHEAQQTFLPVAEDVQDRRIAYVTGYNTVPEQTDNTPCVAAGGYICGRRDTTACPPDIELHTWVQIRGKKYECMDRTAEKYSDRFDISCDKDKQCPYDVTGYTLIHILST